MDGLGISASYKHVRSPTKGFLLFFRPCPVMTVPNWSSKIGLHEQGGSLRSQYVEIRFAEPWILNGLDPTERIGTAAAWLPISSECADQ